MFKTVMRILGLGSGKSAALIFVLSILASIAEISAFVAMAIFVRLIERGDLENLYGVTILYSEKTLFNTAILIPILLLLSLILSLINTVLITRAGRQFFEKIGEEVLNARREELSHGKLSEMASTAQILKYDARYTSVCYLHVLRLLYPVFVTIGLLTLAFTIEPRITMIIVGCVVVLLPAHLKLMKWGNGSAIRLRQGAVERADAIDTYVSRVYRHPNPDMVSPDTGAELSHTPGNQKYMDAYVDRQRLTGYSMAISDISIIAAIIIIAAGLIMQGSTGSFALSNLIIGLIVFRFMIRHTRTIIQSITTIVALQPFCLKVLEAFSSKAAFKSVKGISGEPLATEPVRLAVFCMERFHHWNAVEIGKRLMQKVDGVSGGPVVINGEFDFVDGDWRRELNIDADMDIGQFSEAYPGETAIIHEIESFAQSTIGKKKGAVAQWAKMSRPACFLLASMVPIRKEQVVLVNGNDCLSLSNTQLTAFLERVSDAHVAVLFDMPPRNLRLDDRFQVGVLRNNVVDVIKRGDDYAALAETIKASAAKKTMDEKFYETEAYDT